MRIVSFRTAGNSDGFGVRLPAGVVDLSASGLSLTDLIQMPPRAIAARADDALRKGSKPIAFESLDLLPVVPRPGKFVCLGLNYVDHAKEGGHHELPPYPTLFMRGPTSLQAAGKPIARPALSETLDYEAELAVVIGKGGKAIPEEKALDHVGGYALFNDATIREYQRITTQWTPGKNFDQTGAFGPELVTPDELPRGAIGLAHPVASQRQGAPGRQYRRHDVRRGENHFAAIGDHDMGAGRRDRDGHAGGRRPRP